MPAPTFDLRTQRRMYQAVTRFFLAMRQRYQVPDRELVMLMLAAAFGQAKRIGLTTPQLIEWATKCWGECDREMARSAGGLVIEGAGADETKTKIG